MKLLTPISLLFLSGGGAAFVPLAHRQPLATALAARGKNKAQKAAATLVKSAAPPPPVKEATTTVSSTQVEHSLNGVVGEGPNVEATHRMVAEARAASELNAEATARGLLSARLTMEANSRARVRAAEAWKQSRMMQELTLRGLLKTRLTMEANKRTLAHAEALHQSNVRQESDIRGLLQARFAMEARTREIVAAALAAKEAMEAAALAAKEVEEANALAAKEVEEAAARAAAARIAASKKKSELTARSLLAVRFEMEEKVRIATRAREEERLAAIEAMKDDIEAIRAQPKSPEVEAALQAKYGAMELGERAFNILLDLGYITTSPEPGSPEFDGEDFV